MALAERIAEDLAQECMAFLEAGGDEDVVLRIEKALADQSQTLEEAFIVAMRVLKAEKRARAIMARAKGAAPEAAAAASGMAEDEDDFRIEQVAEDAPDAADRDKAKADGPVMPWDLDGSDA